MPSRFSTKVIFLFLAWTLGSAAMGYALRSVFIHTPSEEQSFGVTLRDQNTPYRFISPLLACSVGADLPSASLDELQKELEELTERNISSGAIEEASIYLRALQSGRWTGQDSDATYTPASLMKLPILIAYLKQSEYNPDLLSYSITITEDPANNQEQDIAPEASVVVGETYTVNELLSLMIVYSDNKALNVLMDYLDFAVLEESFVDLGIRIPEDAATYEINPRLYSRFFRILYNATYLSQENSEKALRLLNSVTFTEGIRSGVPEGVNIAHKFGEASAVLASGKTGHELHDCGIVYADEPYAICIMTKGEHVDELSSFLEQASTIIYSHMQ